MKIVFFAYPAHGHTNPTLPLFQKLVDRGVHVIFYSNDEYKSRIEGIGAEYRDYEVEFLRVDHRIGNLFYLMEQLTGSPFQVIEKHLDRVRDDEPDLIIYDCVAIWGKIIAEQLGTKTVGSFPLMRIDDNQFMEYNLEQVKTGWPFFKRLLTGGPGLFRVIRNIRQLKNRYGYRPDRTPDMFSNTGDINIIYTSKKFHPPSKTIDNSFVFVGPSLGDRPENLDIEESFLKHPGLIYISLGTIFHDQKEFYNNCIRAFGGNERYNVVMSIGDSLKAEDLLPTPENFRIRNRTSQLKILENASLFITHGGMNSVHESLHFRVPMLVLPRALDQFMVANHLKRSGLAHILKKHSPSARELAVAANRVLDDRVYIDRMKHLQLGMDDSDGYKKAADAILNYSLSD